MKYSAHARLTPIRIKTAAIRTVMIFMLKIRFWPALITCAATLIAIALGFWQRDRTHQNAAPIPVTAAPLPLRDVAYHRVRARGRWMPEYTVYLDNRPYHDQPGFYVL